MTSPQYHTGAIHGRFQILHNDHLKYLLAGKSLCKHLIVGITNPDPFQSRMESADPGRNNPLANPLTYYERYVLIRTVFEARGLKPNEFSIVPFPINFPDRYKYYVPVTAIYFLTIYDEWGKQKLRYFQSQGLKTHVLWEVPLERKGISAAEIRNHMIDEKPWEHFVPQELRSLITEWGIPGRLREMVKDSGWNSEAGIQEPEYKH